MTTPTTTPDTPGRARPRRERLARPRTLPVRTHLTVTITVDPATWDREYGTGTDPASVRGDVAAYLRTALESTARVWPALAVSVTPQEATR